VQATAVPLRSTAAPDTGRYRAKQAWRLLQGESPCRVRSSHPPVSSLASMAESWWFTRRTRWTKRRQSILEAAGVTAHPAVLVQLRKGACCGRRGFSRTPKATRDHPSWLGCEGPPASTGRGMQEERRRSTWEAPSAPVFRQAEKSCHRESPPYADGESYRAEYSEVGKAHDRGKDSTEARSPERKRIPDMSDRISMSQPPWGP
jgi:hypothetical protein